MKTSSRVWPYTDPLPWVTVRLGSQSYRARYREDLLIGPYIQLQRKRRFWFGWLDVHQEPLAYTPAISRPSSEQVQRLARKFGQQNPIK